MYDFSATALVNPTQPEEGRRVTLNIELTSACSAAVQVDVLVAVVSDAGEVLYEQRWDDVAFSPSDVYSMTQGFNPVAVKSASYKLQLQVRQHSTGELLFEKPEVARLNFKAP